MTATADLRPPVQPVDPEPQSAEIQRTQAVELLRACARFGITITSDGLTLTARAPKGVLNPGLRATIAEMKPALLEVLKPKTKPDLSDSSYKQRLQRARLLELLGEEGTAEFYRARDEWRHHWDSLPPAQEPW